MKRHSRLYWRESLLVLIGLAVVAGVVVGGFALDRREDRERPMYRDVITMAGLQYDLLVSGQEGVEISVDSEAPVLVGTEPFQPSEGVTIVVERQDDSICVRGSNEDGDETDWHCVDGTDVRPDLGTLDNG